MFSVYELFESVLITYFELSLTPNLEESTTSWLKSQAGLAGKFQRRCTAQHKLLGIIDTLGNG